MGANQRPFPSEILFAQREIAMRLQDEYIKRHKLNFPPIYHTKHANVVLKNQRPELVLTIRWDVFSSIGHYVIRSYTPNHNGYLDGNYFLEVDEDRYCEYHDYFGVVMNLVKNHRLVPVHFDQIRLAIWEMFLYCFDGWIAERNLEELAFQAVNPSCSVDGRIVALNIFLQHLEKNDSLVFEIYNSEFRKYEFNYGDWFVDLMEKQKC